MDKHLLEIAPSSAVVVVPLASKPGADYQRTGAHATAYLSALGADALVAPDARRDPAAAATAVTGAGLVVLTGGSPRQLVDGLTTSGLDAVIRDAAANGAVVMGASAGAMVACATTLLPQWHRDPLVGAGIGLVEGYVVVPHFDGKRTAWVRVALGASPTVLGIPECSGVLVEDGRLTALGVTPTTMITADGRKQLPV
jgi:peptidase E